MTRFVLAVHCHQPVGNFGWVFEEGYQSAYLPFIQMLERHPGVRVAFHYSGALLDWFQKEHPEFLKRLRALVRRGQAEMLGGAYYEPILTLIPRQDALGQLSRMKQALARLRLTGTGTRRDAAGAWLAERVWEPEVPSLLAEAGVRYTVVDDHHLALAGIPEGERFGYYLTEDRGSSVAIFPSSKLLRYLVPFKPVEEVIQALRNFSSDGQRVVVLADDGEKFGMWPGTHNWVYREGWLEAFFQQLERGADWLKMMTFGECLDELRPLGRICLPCASYEEMDQWSGGLFRNFLVKYPEADRMNRKMLWVSARLRGREQGARASARLGKVREHLYKAQSNDAYWHGVFGGLYLRHLRRSVYEHLLKAEEALDQRKGAWVEAQQRVLGGTQAPELLLRSDALSLVVDPQQGGQLVELSDRACGFNLLDVLTRRPEPYHAKIRDRQPVHASAQQGDGPTSIHERQEATAAELSDLLVYDPYPRAGWIDHLWSRSALSRDFAQGEAEEAGDFLSGRYTGRLRKSAASAAAILSRKGVVALEGISHPVELTKEIRLRRGERRVAFSCRLANLGSKGLELLFGSESNLALKDAHVNRIGEAEGLKRFAVTDPAARLQATWTLSRPARLWYFPIETVSDSERGMERTYQGVSLTFLWPLRLPPRGSWTVTWTLDLEQPDGRG